MTHAYDADAPGELPDVIKKMFASLKEYATYWDGVPLKPAQSVEMMMEVIRKAGPEDSGAFLSHHGNQQWL